MKPGTRRIRTVFKRVNKLWPKGAPYTPGEHESIGRERRSNRSTRRDAAAALKSMGREKAKQIDLKKIKRLSYGGMSGL